MESVRKKNKASTNCVDCPLRVPSDVVHTRRVRHLPPELDPEIMFDRMQAYLKREAEKKAEIRAVKERRSALAKKDLKDYKQKLEQREIENATSAARRVISKIPKPGFFNALLHYFRWRHIRNNPLVHMIWTSAHVYAKLNGRGKSFGDVVITVSIYVADLQDFHCSLLLGTNFMTKLPKNRRLSLDFQNKTIFLGDIPLSLIC
ncbi:hypothetical protein L596_015993 [Steinernema carpocapsae]|uniref:Uncharacterized protein n=1 Tax=Steinernema carpocapsae TaxID=34508 RepID=A0A4U5NHQ5_STECR|nr:hypothetical protein L596_015993 [Steinernema carpocapsae]